MPGHRPAVDILDRAHLPTAYRSNKAALDEWTAMACKHHLAPQCCVPSQKILDFSLSQYMIDYSLNQSVIDTSGALNQHGLA